jgi:glycosyltransferase involved in cell wall biosynthesis
VPRRLIKRRSLRGHDVAFYVPRMGPLLVMEGITPAGGAETQILLLARALVRRGVRVCLSVFDLPGIAIPRFVDGVEVSIRPPYLARRRLGKIREVITIFRAIANVDADVVVVRMESPEVGLAALFSRLLGRRFVYSSASLSDFVADPSLAPQVDLSRLSRKGRDWKLFQLGVRLADQVVVQTEEQARLSKDQARRPTVIIRSIAEPAPLRESEPEAFLWIGRIVPSKRPEAFVELARSLPEAKFWMIAVPANERADHVELMTALERGAAAAPNLELLAPRPRGELMQLVNGAIAMVSTSDFEGMPNTFLEGWARGVPALALAHDPDGVIERYRLGSFAGGSPGRLATLASSLWNERRDQSDLAERCRQYVLDYHSPEAVSARWLEVLGINTRVTAAESVVA